jgi:hypothetical protein
MSKFAVFSGVVILETADVVTDPKLRRTFNDAVAEWQAAGQVGPYPKIRAISLEDQQAVTRVVARGSLDEQVATVITALQATLFGTVRLDVTSNHIKQWLSGDWKAKSAVAQALLAAVDAAKSRQVTVTVA